MTDVGLASIGGPEAAGERTISGRFVVRRPLGRGGMAAVFEVSDLHSGRPLALKRLDRNPDPKKQQRTAQLFEREFHTLCQLAHPRVVQVYDYAVDDEGPYYTMELLDGGDLQQIAPVPWRKACAIVRDVCSALSLLHSRRAVHRDVSPRNVRCAQDGSAKLIDFGAMAPMGPSKIMMGTPPCCAPEIVHMQALDARTDLYALGATLYYTLVGRHAYPARHFSGLPEIWLSPLPRPSQFVADIPAALDTLVLDLLRLDPDARPSSAAEVMQRLSAIDGCALDEGLMVAQAYLSTPTLVGREQDLTRVRSKIKRMTRSRGSAVAIRGESGMGRSRLLDACVLEATLLGATVMRTDADRAVPGDYGVVRTFARELLQVMPDEALAAASAKLGLLAHAIPELLELAPNVSLQPLASDVLRSQLQPALREWLIALSKQRPLVFAIDDFQRVDEPSATVFALLALELRNTAVAVLATLESGATPVSEMVCKLFSEAASQITLRPLRADDTESLLRSLFGDTPHVDVLAHRLHGLAVGNPRDVMRLAQDLVDRRMVQYRAGAWTLPAVLGDADLPPSMRQAREMRIEALSPSAHALAAGLSLCPDLSFSREECALLCGAGADCGSQLDELLSAQVVREVQDDFALSQEVWGGVLRGMLSDEQAGVCHARLAEVIGARRNAPFRVGQHLLMAAQTDRALDVLVEHATQSQETTAHGEHLFFKYVQSLPADWLSVFSQAIRLCDERERPASHKFALLSRLAGILAMLAIDDQAHLRELLDLLKRYSGLDDWAALDPSLEPMARLTKALEQTQARYNATPERDRVLDPLAAIRQLARALISASAVVVMSLEVRDVRALPSLGPLVPLAPALGVIDLMIQGVCARYTARFENALVLYKQLLQRIAAPDRGGLDASHGGYTRKGVMNGVGMIEAGLGLASCLEYAKELEQDPSHCVNALQIRMLYEVWQGNFVAADSCKRDVDRMRIQNSARHWFEGGHLLWETTAYALSDDLTRIKHALEAVKQLAQRYPAWTPVARYAAANYQRIRGDYAGALAEIEPALATTRPADHQFWIHLATTHVQVLNDLDRPAEALRLGEQYMAQAQQAEVGYALEYLRMALAVTHAKLGNRDAALASTELALNTFTTLGATGLSIGLAHETRARVSLLLDDSADFEHYAALCREVYCGRKNRALTAKHEKLIQEAKRAAGVLVLDQMSLSSSQVISNLTVATALRPCRSPAERASVALTLLKQQSGADDGFLFAPGETGPECVARLGDSEPSDSMIAMVRSYLASELEDAHTTATDSLSEARSSNTEWLDSDGQKYRVVLLSHQLGGSLVVTGVAVLISDISHPFVFPAQIASTLSKYASDAGDHSVMVTH